MIGRRCKCSNALSRAILIDREAFPLPSNSLLRKPREQPEYSCSSSNSLLLLVFHLWFSTFVDIKISGDYRKRATPVPIPNTEVKTLIADGT